MSTALILGCLWVLASAIVAFLPMRRQYAPGLALLIAAPVLIGFIAHDHGFWFAFAAVLAFSSMFRNPLIYIVRRMLGLPVMRPEDSKDRPQ